MTAKAAGGAHPLHSRSVLFPSLLLSLTPLFDSVQLITRDPAWGAAAFWAAVAAALVVAASLLPELADWRSSDRHTAARRARAAPLTMHLAALAPLALGVYERLRLAAVTRAAAEAALPSIPRLDVWPMALAIAGGIAWLAGGWMAEERNVARVRYQPTDLPFSS